MANILKNNAPFDVDDLGQLLQARSDHNSITEQITRLTPINSPKTRAERSATLYDFIKMVSEIVTKGTKERNIIFEPDEGARPRVDQEMIMNNPYIFYEVISRRAFGEFKPRPREEIIEDEEGRLGRVWGQKFESIVQFNIFARDYAAANKTMETFEDLMFNYISYFKRNGIVEILFEEQSTDHDYDYYRQGMSVRHLRYRVWTEQLRVNFAEGDISGMITQ